jgi:Uma2 family endonuclease
MLPAPAKSRRKLEPTWEIAHLFPAQGMWSEQEYLDLNANRLVEFSHGHVEVLPVPTTSHQFIALFLYRLLEAFASAHALGETIAAPLRVRLWPGKYREPDVVFLLRQHAARIAEQFWDGADLVMEVVSDDDRRRDVETKRLEYARAGIGEYWIIDPRAGSITVLQLAGKRYVVHGEFFRGTVATSALLAGFEVDVSQVLAKGRSPSGRGTRKQKK